VAVPVAICPTVCDYVYAGTREGVILVSRTPFKPAARGATAADRTPAAAAKRGVGIDPNRGLRRAELADFLRTRREAIRPEDVGLPNGGRRRTPGLRREEVAQLAGVGTTWYTWLEQGRNVRASLSVLEAIGRALELTAAERTYLIELGRGDGAPAEAPPKECVSPTLRRLVENLDAPAFVLGRRWDYLAWNRAYTVLFGDPLDLPEGRRNLIWALLTDPALRTLLSGWEDSVRNAVARFRADSATHVGDPCFEELIADLRQRSPEFREFWSRHEVVRSGEGRKILRHPAAGSLYFEHAVFKREEATDQRLILYSPLPKGETPAKLAKLLAEPTPSLGRGQRGR
jgi:transcriptional regulator with XRE-family HTH domain